MSTRNVGRRSANFGYPWVFQKVCPGSWKSLWFRIIDALPEILRDVESILVPFTDRSDYSGSSWKCQIGVTRYVQKSQVKKKKIDNETTRTKAIVNLWVRGGRAASKVLIVSRGSIIFATQGSPKQRQTIRTFCNSQRRQRTFVHRPPSRFSTLLLWRLSFS